MKLGLEGKVVVVTGGSKGIGRAIVQGFLEEGAIVHFCSRSQSAIDAAQTYFDGLSITSTYAVSFQADVSIPSHIERWIRSIILLEKRINIVISNVSSLSMANDAAGWQSAYQTDMLGTVNLINACLPHLEKSKGSIVTISSVLGRDVDFKAPSPYGAFKAALIHYTSQLAHTLASKGVRANTSQMEKNPMKRMGKASEVADAVVWVASERAAFLSGANLVVDGALCSGVQF